MSDDDDRSKALPSSRLGRFARLATVGLRSGASQLLGRDGSNAAEHAAEVLGTMRGLAAKVGQMASYVDGLVPEGQRDAYERAMKHLRAAAPTSSSTQVAATLREELGNDPAQLFAEWDTTPIASASIGQVHRARLHDGREVAVKVQHHGVAKAVESDLSNASILEGMAGAVVGKRFNTKAHLSTVKERFREELDYALEADRIETFQQLHAHDAAVRIPGVVRERSSARVLTTEFVRGRSFDEAIAASEEERRAWATTMWRFVFGGTLLGGLFNADPHPGNYIFLDDGRVAFLDFGCVQTVSPQRRTNATAMHLAAMRGDESAFRVAVDRLVDAKPGRMAELSYAYMKRCFDPVLRSPYRITREYAAELLQMMRDMAQAARKAPEHEFFPMPADALFMNRLQFGFYSVLARLDVSVDYRAVEESFLGP